MHYNINKKNDHNCSQKMYTIYRKSQKHYIQQIKVTNKKTPQVYYYTQKNC